MNKKYILIIAMILFGFCCMCAVSANLMGSDQINYKLPDGYAVGKLNDEGDINLTSGNNTIFIAKYDDNNITDHMDDFLDFLDDKGYSSNISTFTLENNKIYNLSIENNTKYYRYWFVKNDNAYSVYTWDGNSDVEKIMVDLISSIN